jgi:hypothetical protein
MLSTTLAAHRLVEDTAWHPAGKAELEKWGPMQRALFKIFLGSPLKLWASVGHWWLWHFDLSLYTDKQKPRVSKVFRPISVTADCELRVKPALRQSVSCHAHFIQA